MDRRAPCGYLELLLAKNADFGAQWDVFANPTPHCPDCGKGLLTHCPDNKWSGPLFDQRQGPYS